MNDQELIALRPIIATEKIPDGELEQFQTATLRPILKMQNDFILQSFYHEIEIKRISLQELTLQQKQEQIETLIKTNKQFQFLLIGSITGLFTTPERNFYFLNTAAINKRITAFLIQRITSQL